MKKLMATAVLILSAGGLTFFLIYAGCWLAALSGAVC